MPQDVSSYDDAPLLNGELSSAPRGPLKTAIFAVTGLLLVIEIGKLIGRHVLSFRRPVDVLVTPAGIEVRGVTALLGKPLRDHATVIPRDGLVRVTREVRYPGAAMYAGLGALAIGSYVGVGLFVDGARAESPSMLGTGILIALLGLAVDFALSSLLPGALGRSRLLLVPRRGPVICITAIDVTRADRLLAKLAKPVRPSARSMPSVDHSGGADRPANEAERHGAGEAR